MSLKITFIGAGSLVFARTLFTDIMSVPELQKAEISFTDINPDNLEKTRELCQRDLDANGIPVVIEATTDRRAALKDARYIVNCVRVGGLEGFETDIEIPLKYGVDQCVGDTLCTGGIMYGQRVIAAMLDFCKDIREVSEPGAIMLNYPNPNAMATWACNKYGGVKTLGLCHGEIHGEMQIAEVLGIPREELDITCAGINHQAFYLDFEVDGKDAYPDLYKAIEREEVAAEEPVRIEMFKKLGYFNTESSGHNSEYVAWFRKRPDLIEKYCTHGTGWNPGAYGFILDEYLGREDTWEKEYTDWLENGEVDLERGEEYASNIFNAVFGDHTPYFFNGNLKNHGYITNVKQGVCVEVPTVATEAGIVPIKQITLPDHLAVLVNNSALIEDLAVKAAIEGDPNLVFQAVLYDPLTSAVCSMDEILNMVQEMLDKNAEYLSYFKSLKINMEVLHEKENR